MKTIEDIRTVYHRSRATLLQDALGMVALGVLLVASLHLPSIF